MLNIYYNIIYLMSRNAAAANSSLNQFSEQKIKRFVTPTAAHSAPKPQQAAPTALRRPDNRFMN